MNYNYSIKTVQYNDDDEYRETLKQLCNWNPDEIEYDEENMSKALDEVYDYTYTNPFFKDLYSLAAIHMMSEDITIGLAILFSYDFLHLFHPCLYIFHHKPHLFNDALEEYNTIKNALIIKK